MKRILLLLVAIAGWVNMTAQTTVATVNRETLLHGLPEYATAQAELKSLSDAYRQEYTAMQRDFNDKYADYQETVNGDTPATIRDRRIKELQDLDNKLKDFRRASEDDLTVRRDALLAPLHQAIDAAIASVAAERGIDLVLDVSKTPVAYAGASVVDITGSVASSLK